MFEKIKEWLNRKLRQNYFFQLTFFTSLNGECGFDCLLSIVCNIDIS